jgi:hypothetical protein
MGHDWRLEGRNSSLTERGEHTDYSELHEVHLLSPAQSDTDLNVLLG